MPRKGPARRVSDPHDTNFLARLGMFSLSGFADKISLEDATALMLITDDFEFVRQVRERAQTPRTIDHTHPA